MQAAKEQEREGSVLRGTLPNKPLHCRAEKCAPRQQIHIQLKEQRQSNTPVQHTPHMHDDPAGGTNGRLPKNTVRQSAPTHQHTCAQRDEHPTSMYLPAAMM